MRQYCFVVEFVTGEKEHVIASDKKCAIILAQAEQIKKGNQYHHIQDVYTIE